MLPGSFGNSYHKCVILASVHAVESNAAASAPPLLRLKTYIKIINICGVRLHCCKAPILDEAPNPK